MANSKSTNIYCVHRPRVTDEQFYKLCELGDVIQQQNNKKRPQNCINKLIKIEKEMLHLLTSP